MATPLPATPASKIISESVPIRRPHNLSLFGAKVGVAQNGSGPLLHFAGTPNSGNQAATGLLPSWKDISAYLERGVRTAQRWEQTLGLPVHRIGGGKRAPVFAFKHEIDAWLRQNASRARVNAPGLAAKRAGHLNSGRQWFLKFVEELRQNALELEQEVATGESEPNGNITAVLLTMQKLVNAALARNQVARSECAGQMDARAKETSGSSRPNPSAESVRFLD
jgi:hypothetical protein